MSWKYAESTVCPAEVEKVAGKVILRRNIEEVERESEDGEAQVMFIYEELWLTVKEYNEYVTDLERPSVVTMMQKLNDIQADIALK